MEKSLPVINNAATGCGSCHSTGCEPCSSTASKKETAPVSRRELARTAFMGGAAAILARHSKAQVTAAGDAADEVTDVSSDLAVVKKSKGPVMTQVDEFFKMGPGPSSSHTMGPMRITY